jgi:hypothetical protein
VSRVVYVWYMVTELLCGALASLLLEFAHLTAWGMTRALLAVADARQFACTWPASLPFIALR